jgi:hypothetical protein
MHVPDPIKKTLDKALRIGKTANALTERSLKDPSVHRQALEKHREATDLFALALDGAGKCKAEDPLIKSMTDKMHTHRGLVEHHEKEAALLGL